MKFYNLAIAKAIKIKDRTKQIFKVEIKTVIEFMTIFLFSAEPETENVKKSV